jgi:type II secretion system protein H
VSQDRRLSRQAGVSLIEVLAALAIVALMGAVAMVMLDGRRTALDVSAERLTRALGEARQEALMSGRVIGFGAAHDQRGWMFYEYTAGGWRVIEDHPAFEPARLVEGLVLEVREGGIAARGAQSETLAPQVWFDPAGFDAPFLYALFDGEEIRFVARLDDGQLRLGGAEAYALVERDR